MLDGNVMSKDVNFRDAYQKIEWQIKLLAEDDGDIYVPNLEPAGPVDYVLICMEPSRGRWARTAEEAKSKIEAGFRNFIFSIETATLHFCVRRYLCESTQRYHITDLSKGAMFIDKARNARVDRYDRWYPLLKKELSLVATANAEFIAVGQVIAKQLKRQGFRPFKQIIHYSGQAAKARKDGIRDREDSFQAFKNSVLLEDVITNLKDVLKIAQVPAAIRDKAVSDLEKSQLSTSRLHLISTTR